MSIPLAVQSKVLFGAVLKKLRVDYAVGQLEMAQALGLNQSTMSRIEAGKSTLSVEQLLTYSSMLGIPSSYVLASYEAQVISIEGDFVLVTKSSVPEGYLELQGQSLASLLV